MTQSTIPAIWSSDNAAQNAHLAAAAFLARYRGRTLDAYRHDLRDFFQWASDLGLDVLAASRPHIELYRAAMEERGHAASTIDRRLATVCGYYRLAHIDGRIASNPEQYVRRPKVPPSTARGLDRGELGTFLFTAERFDRVHAALAVFLRAERSPSLGSLRDQRRGSGIRTRSSHPAHHWLGQQAGRDPARAAVYANDRSRGRRTSRGTDTSSSRRRTARSENGASLGSFDRKTSRSWVDPSAHTATGLHHGSAGRRVPLRDVQIAARHTDPRTTTIYDHRRENFDRHTAYVVVAFVAGGRGADARGLPANGGRVGAIVNRLIGQRQHRLPVPIASTPDLTERAYCSLSRLPV